MYSKKIPAQRPKSHATCAPKHLIAGNDCYSIAEYMKINRNLFAINVVKFFPKISTWRITNPRSMVNMWQNVRMCTNVVCVMKNIQIERIYLPTWKHMTRKSNSHCAICVGNLSIVHTIWNLIRKFISIFDPFNVQCVRKVSERGWYWNKWVFHW